MNDCSLAARFTKQSEVAGVVGAAECFRVLVVDLKGTVFCAVSEIKGLIALVLGDGFGVKKRSQSFSKISFSFKLQ